MEKKSNLRLNLKAKWYDMIESGEKKEEYRIFKPYWEKRLAVYNEQHQQVGWKHFNTITFVYGYTKRTMTFKCNGMEFGKGKSEWGAPPYDVIKIKIGDRIDDQKS